nr:hypothetical protein [Tanacetum cinerariifolium]
MKFEALAEQAKPVRALTVYPPNTPVKLVPKVLPTKSQVKINIFALIQLFSKSEKICKMRITLTCLTGGEMGFEQTKNCYLTEAIFDELEAEVDKNAVNRKCDEIEQKNLLITNDTLIANCLSKEVLYIAMNSKLNVSRFSEMHDAHTVVQARCLELESELSKLKDKIKKDDHYVMEGIPQDSSIDAIDEDMFLETLLDDNPTRIRRYPEEFLVLVGLSRMWCAPSARPSFTMMMMMMRIASKAGEFVPGITSDISKRLTAKGKKPGALRKPLSKNGQLAIFPSKYVVGESAVGSSQEAANDLCSSEAGSQPLVSMGSSKTSASLSSASTLEDSAETPHGDRFYASMSVNPSVAEDIYHSEWESTNYFILDKGPLCRKHAELARGKLERILIHHDAAIKKRDAKIQCLQKLLNEQPFGEMAPLRLGFEVAEREKSQPHPVQIHELSLQVKLQDKRMVDQHKLQCFQVRGMHVIQSTKDICVHFRCIRVVGRGRMNVCALLPMRKTSLQTLPHPIRDSRRDTIAKSGPNNCISAAISDGMSQGLEASFVHGKKGTDIHSTSAYNPNAAEVYADVLSALNDMHSPYLKTLKLDEAGTSTNPTFDETSSISGDAEQFIIATSIPYDGDGSANAQDVRPVDEVVSLSRMKSQLEPRLMIMLLLSFPQLLLYPLLILPP